jgi:cytochrome c biogenesis protein CcmG, thiol:disulfide interchange protein DsbE
MNASRRRGGALLAALLAFAGILAFPPTRAIVRHAAHRLGLLASAPQVEIGRPLGVLRLASLDGSTVALGPRPGHAMLINVFATWCSPCQDEAPLFASLAPKLARSGVDIIGVDQGESGAQVARFAKVYNVRYPVYVDADANSRITLGARVIPTTLVIDERGIVRSIHVGPLDSPQLLAMTKAARDP